ncbi:MAG TPA: iron-containing alcohol dehydrogenase, partial [Chloroflexota bacterium]|nr:iron-containing alcohol dehydrogenase [Chloroflexota bacterium]
MSDFEKARQLMKEFQGDKYLFGSGVIGQVGRVAAELGKKAAFICDVFPSNEAPRKAVHASLKAAGVELVKEIEGAKPNAPREDISRITEELKSTDADVIICLG